MSEKKVKEVKTKRDKELPRYLRIDKGSMWFDIEGENASGVRLFSMTKVLIGRKPGEKEVPLDENKNDNIVDFGKVSEKLDWFVDTSAIPSEKLSRILTAYNNGILVEADPSNPPQSVTKPDNKTFQVDKKGDLIFKGKNEEIYKKLQNLNFNQLRNFVTSTPNSFIGKQNLIDMFDYESKGHNPLGRSRFEVMELIKTKLREMGNGLSSIRVNEELEEKMKKSKVE